MNSQQQPHERYKAAQSLIREFEGFVDHAYPDIFTDGAPWTIGCGFTHINNTSVQPGQTITISEALDESQAKVIAYAEHLAEKIPY